MADKNIDPRLLDSFYLVEADVFSYITLWKELHEEYEWKDDASTLFVYVVGNFHKMPIVVQFRYAMILGRRVAFYHATSQVVHWGMIEKWLKENVPSYAAGRHTDADNFHRCLHAIERENEQAAVTG